jgi:alkylation response protein AidB-like acyl-CoA dehydrogenase
MTDSPSSDPTARARELLPLVRECADEAERERRLPARVADAMAAAGLYRIAAPASVGGECEPRSQIETIEMISAADGATGWNLMIGIENMGFLGAVLDLETARKLYADPGLIVSGALNPLGRATPCDGGFRITGQWPFASGCHNAGWFWGQCIVMDGDEPAKSEQGGGVLREVLIPAQDFEILDTWHVSGLRGSGSHDVAARDVFVPAEHVTAAMAGGIELRETGTLYRFPPFNRLAYNKVGVATGIARGAIEHFKELAGQKLPRGSRKLLRDKVSVQLAVAEAETQLRQARAFVFESIEDVWQATLREEPVSAEQRVLVHLACTNACQASIRAVEIVCSAAGTTANFTSCPLERCMRDVRVVPQHIMVSPQWAEVAGRVLLGLEGDSPFFNN